MNTNSKPEVAADKAREAYRQSTDQFEALLKTAFPQAAREFADKTVAQTREAYERSAGQGTAALNRKIIEIAQWNLNSGFDLAKSLAGAKNLAEIVELQAAHWQKQIDALTAQAEEVRALATKVAADTVEPTKAHMTRSMNDVGKTS
jgi:hypothetical protein